VVVAVVVANVKRFRKDFVERRERIRVEDQLCVLNCIVHVCM
jgi:hypothetical protein